jgi:undecaprenyl-diphosphatase
VQQDQLTRITFCFCDMMVGMTTIESIVLGLTQGVTEFVPVSSSGHLTIAQRLLGTGADHLFIEFINIGTLLALLVFFRHKLWRIGRDVVVKKDHRLALNLLITSVPAGVIGFFLAKFISSDSFFASTSTVITAMFVIGVVMIVLEKLPRASVIKDGSKLPRKRALVIGLAQVLALIPGVSRSGATIIAGRLSGLKAKEAAEYSFLASIPIMCGLTLKMFIGKSDLEYLAANWPTLLLSNTVAFISGLIAIFVVLKYLGNRKSLQVFGWYRVILATIVMMIIW